MTPSRSDLLSFSNEICDTHPAIKCVNFLRGSESPRYAGTRILCSVGPCLVLPEAAIEKVDGGLFFSA